MLVALDLTARQAVRVLNQALQEHARLEIDPRPIFLASPLVGALESAERDCLVVQLTENPGHVSPATLLGAMCDVRTMLSGQLYLFSAPVLEATEGPVPRLRLGRPTAIQVANRRQFARRTPTETVPVRLLVPGAAQPLVAQITNLSRSGLGCHGPRRELDETLLIGDQIQVEFMLPWAPQVYRLPATVCTKNASPDQTRLNVGLEFAAHDAASRANLELLRSVLDNETQRLLDVEGDTP
jgi:hypothetical protein